MKLEMTNKIQALIDGYKANCTVQGDAIKKVLEPYKTPSYAKRFTKEGLKETITEEVGTIISDWKKYDLTMNDQVKAAIDTAKKEINTALHIDQEAVPSDYALKIANAREFMKMELGHEHKDLKELDDALFMILKDFIDDYDTMKLFGRMVENQTDINLVNSTGQPSLPKTFGKMMMKDSIFNVIGEIDEAATMLFIHARTTSDEFIRINGDAYGIPVDGYSEIEDETNIIANATVLDALAAKIDTEGQADK